MNRDWAKQYWDFMMSEKYDPGFELKYEHFPNSFFRYRKLCQKTIDSISENYIWLAEIASLNDPFECSLQFDSDKSTRLFFASKEFHLSFKKKFGKELTKSEIENIVTNKEPFRKYAEICKGKNIVMEITPEEQLEKIQRRWLEIIEETNASIRICSFSELNDSLLLWSHYADAHRGICIEYDLVEEGPEIRAFLQPIVYSDTVHKIELFEELTTLRKIGSTLIKSKEWEYEREWRVTIFKQNDTIPNKMTISKPKAVYLGTRFYLNEENLKQQLLKILKEQNIPAFHMTKHPKEYKLIKQ
jgi:hypothetical protein